MKKIILLLAFLALQISHGQKPPALELSIIVHKDNPVEKTSITEVRNYWMRRGAQKAWPILKTTVLPVDRKSTTPEKAVFYKKVVALSEADVEAYFAAKQYQSAESPPVKTATDRDVIQYVSDNRGAIGFINSGSLTDADKQAVKVVCLVVE
jgi:ABC-type phosphate transport system substrate-binding protein